jgi:hypothetical protein
VYFIAIFFLGLLLLFMIGLCRSAAANSFGEDYDLPEEWQVKDSAVRSLKPATIPSNRPPLKAPGIQASLLG